MGEIYPSANYVIYVLISSFDIYQDNGKLLPDVRLSFFSQRVAAVNKFNNFVIPKAKAENNQCISTALFMSAQLKLAGILHSITDEICSEAKGIVKNSLVLKRFGIFFTCKIQQTKINLFRLSSVIMCYVSPFYIVESVSTYSGSYN